jgi:hypothetical protein
MQKLDAAAFAPYTSLRDQQTRSAPKVPPAKIDPQAPLAARQ